MSSSQSKIDCLMKVTSVELNLIKMKAKQNEQDPLPNISEDEDDDELIQFLKKGKKGQTETVTNEEKDNIECECTLYNKSCKNVNINECSSRKKKNIKIKSFYLLKLLFIFYKRIYIIIVINISTTPHIIMKEEKIFTSHLEFYLENIERHVTKTVAPIKTCRELITKGLLSYGSIPTVEGLKTLVREINKPSLFLSLGCGDYGSITNTFMFTKAFPICKHIGVDIKIPNLRITNVDIYI